MNDVCIAMIALALQLLSAPPPNADDVLLSTLTAAHQDAAGADIKRVTDSWQGTWTDGDNDPSTLGDVILTGQCNVNIYLCDLAKAWPLGPSSKPDFMRIGCPPPQPPGS